jgi:MFS family permease
MSTTGSAIRGRELGMLAVLCGAIFLEGIDVAMLNVALPAIRADLGLSTSTLSGVVSAYVLGYGGFLLLGGRAADVLGRRRMFLLWLTVFLVFSGLGGLATEGWMLLLARFVTGVAAGFMAPAALSLITSTFPEGPRRNKALLVYAGIASGGFSLGLTAGGVLATLGWRWVFFAPVILSAALLAAAIPLLRESAAPPAERPESFDLAGAFTITGGMLALVYGVVRLEHPSEGTGWTVLAFTASLVLLTAFVVIERRSPAPLVRLGILRSAPLIRANLGALILLGSWGGFQFMVTLYLQELRGWSPLETGLAMLVVTLDMILAPTLTPRLVSRFGNARVIFGGMVLILAAYAMFLPVGLDWTYAAMLPAFVTVSLAFALGYGPLTIAATDGIEEEEHGLAGGLLYTSIQFGTAIGISATSAVHVAALGSARSPQAALDAIHTGLLIPLCAAAVGVVILAFGLGKPKPAAEVLSPVNAPQAQVSKA